MDLPGSLFAAMLTPMNGDGAVAPEAVAPLVDYILSRGIHGLYASGSTGEGVLQSVAERAEVLNALGEYGRDKCTLIAHVGAAATDDAIALAETAAKAGFHAISAVPPYYYKHGFADISAYYRAIAGATDLPLIIYNIPGLSGAELSTENLLELMQDDRVGGMKYTAKDLYQFGELRRALPDKTFYFGTDEMFIGAAAAGTDGGIGSTYNLIGHFYVAIETAIAVGDLDTARDYQNRANELISILLRAGVIPGLKHCLNRIGVPVGPARAPFREPSADQINELNEWMDDNELSG